MATRKKKKIITGVTPEEMEAAFAEYAKADSRTNKIKAEMELQITRIREKNQEELNQLQKVMDEKFDVMQAYAQENKENLFGKKKSLETVHGVIGFRLGTPKLKTRKGFTWESVLQLLKTYLPDYVRTKHEAAKDKLIADREKKMIVEDKGVKTEIALQDRMAICGVVVDEDESFYVEPKKEA